jgi:uncharacterized protein YuzE
MVETLLRRIALQCDYDPDDDTAHIHVADPGTVSGPLLTRTCHLGDIGGQIHLHFSSDGRLVMVEVPSANRKLPDSVLKQLSR